MLHLTDTVKHLIIINVLIYFSTMLLMGNPVSSIPADTWEWGRQSLALFSPSSTYHQPFQFITSMFMHSDDLTHLFFNMLALYFFGCKLEVFWKPKKFLFYYLATGVGASLLYLAAMYIEAHYTGNESILEYGRAWGASGSVFGILLAYAMYFPEEKISLIFPPITAKVKYFVSFYIIAELFMGVKGMDTGVAHFAHLGGALFGFLIIMYWRKVDNRW